MNTVRFHPTADEELVEATEWYIARSAVAAAGFVREIEHALAQIAEAPLDAPPRASVFEA
jgi:plasmid stabilization system protein ParE